MNADYAGKNPLFIAIPQWLIHVRIRPVQEELTVDAEICFIKTGIVTKAPVLPATSSHLSASMNPERRAWSLWKILGYRQETLCNSYPNSPTNNHQPAHCCPAGISPALVPTFTIDYLGFTVIPKFHSGTDPITTGMDGNLPLVIDDGQESKITIVQK